MQSSSAACYQLHPPKATGIIRHATPIIPYGGGGWMDSQTQEPVLFDDPMDSTKLRMYFAAMAAPVASGVMSIGWATATKANPLVWTVQGQLITDISRRLDSIVVVGGVWYMYSSNTHSIDLFTSTDGLTWTFNSTALTPTGQGRNDGDYVSQGTVAVSGGTWYMIYGYRNGGTVLPGYRLATSTDGITWTKTGAGDILSCGTESYSPDKTYMEFHSIIKVGATWVLLYEAFNVDLGVNGSWAINVATATSPAGPWTKAPATMLGKSGVTGQFDQYQVATPCLYQINGTWWLYFQGANGSGNYNLSNWSLGAGQLAGTPLDFM